MKVLPQVKRAALFAADVLSSVDLKPFLKKHGIKDKLYSKRLVDRLRSTYSLQPAPRQGRPRVHTADELCRQHRTSSRAQASQCTAHGS